MTDLTKLSDRELNDLLRTRYHYRGSYLMNRTREWDNARDDSVDWMVRMGGDVL
jgi:hypothetical protein